MYLEKRQGKKGDKWRVHIYRNGERISETFRTKKEAEDWAKKKEIAAETGGIADYRAFSKTTFLEVAEKYEKDVLPTKPRAKQENIVARLKRDLGHLTLDKFNTKLICEYRDKLLGETTVRGEKRSSSTVRRIFVTLSHIFSKASKEWEFIKNNPVLNVEKPKESKPKVRFLNKQEREKLFDACRESSNSLLYPLVVLSISCGARQGELRQLKWEDVDFEKERIILRLTKNNETRSVPLKGHALELLKKLKDNSSTEWIFPNKSLNGPGNFRASWGTALKKSEVQNFTMHSLRHCCASYLAMQGYSLLVIAEVLGHKTLSVVKRYAHLAESYTSEAVEKMNENIFGDKV